MHQAGKGQAIYIASLGVFVIIFFVLLVALIECRQTNDLMACSLRWGNFGLSVQYEEHLVVWLLGFNDLRLWPLRQNLPLALFWSFSLMALSVAGMIVTLGIAFVDHVIQVIRQLAP